MSDFGRACRCNGKNILRLSRISIDRGFTRGVLFQLQSVFMVLIVSLGVVSVASAQTSQDWPRLQTAEWTKTNFKRMSIDASEIMSGGPPRDGIPSIDAPQFVNVEQAAEWISPDEPVVAFVHNGDARAYPLQIMMFHEIVNDVVGEHPVSVTFCPLCNASIVFDRKVEGQILDFGTTGRLRKSDLVMYDRQTESWWQQFTGTGIIGDYVDVKLTQLPSQIVSYEMFATHFPQGSVLSRKTGFQRQYGQNPYAGYDSIDNSPFLYRDKLDPRLPPMERVLSIPKGDAFQLIPLSLLENQRIVQLQSAATHVVVLAPGDASSALDKRDIASSRKVPVAAAFDREVNGQLLDFDLKDGQVFDRQTGSRWSELGKAVDGKLAGTQLEQLDRGVHFAFAWLAFDPGADIFLGE